MSDVTSVCCPTGARHKDDLVGCGSTHLRGPDEEGLYDCLECGLFFTEAASASDADVHVKGASSPTPTKF